MEIPSALCECAVRVQVEGKEKIAGGGGGGGEGKRGWGGKLGDISLWYKKKAGGKEHKN